MRTAHDFYVDTHELTAAQPAAEFLELLKKRLDHLPAPILDQAAKHLKMGARTEEVVRWLLTHPDCQAVLQTQEEFPATQQPITTTDDVRGPSQSPRPASGGSAPAVPTPPPSIRNFHELAADLAKMMKITASEAFSQVYGLASASLHRRQDLEERTGVPVPGTEKLLRIMATAAKGLEKAKRVERARQQLEDRLRRQHSETMQLKHNGTTGSDRPNNKEKTEEPASIHV